MAQKDQVVLPGDKLAVSEEFLPGPNASDDEGIVRALTAGKVQRDMQKMEISVKPAVKADVIKVGDSVLGRVEVSQSNSAIVKIYYVNGRQTDKDFSGTLSLKSQRSGRGGPRGRPMGPPVKLGDLVRCRVFSLLNGIIHLSIEEEQMGVLYAECGNCGRPLLRGGNKVKCEECGNVEERKLANDFGKSPIRP